MGKTAAFTPPLRFRRLLTALVCLQITLSIQFFRLGKLHFYLEESNKIMPVSKLKSTGSDEDYVLFFGNRVYWLLLVFYLRPWSKTSNKADILALRLVVFFTGFLILICEVSSLPITIGTDYGRFLAVWLGNYLLLIMFSFVPEVQLVKSFAMQPRGPSR